MREVDIARPVVDHMRDLGWTVYQEVEAHGGRADIVATLGDLVWVVEAKTSLSLKLLEQACNWLGQAHYVSVAVPHPRKFAHRRFALGLFRDRGIGVFAPRSTGLKMAGLPSVDVNEVVEPHMLRRPSLDALRELRRRLRPEMIDYVEAGDASGTHWTPWKGTRDKIAEEVRRNPGISLRDLITGNAGYHYHTTQSARSSIAKNVELGLVPGVRLVRDGRVPRLYLDDVE